MWEGIGLRSSSGGFLPVGILVLMLSSLVATRFINSTAQCLTDRDMIPSRRSTGMLPGGGHRRLKTPTSGCIDGSPASPTLLAFRQRTSVDRIRRLTMRTFLSKAFLAFAITTVATFAADNTIGTWKLNVEKSKY